MRRTVLSLALVLLASPAGAEPVLIWQGFTLHSPISFPHTFRLATSESAFIETSVMGGPAYELRPTDNAAAAAFFASLTDGDLDTITWSTNDWSETMDENRFFGFSFSAPPLRGASNYWYFTEGKTDLAGAVLDRIEFSVGTSNGMQRHNAYLYGAFPEPSSAIMLLLGCAHCVTASSFRRRRPSIAR